MSSITDFEAYLKSKKIDSAAFRSAEPDIWSAWASDFAEMHANSFTVRKLNLINPIRRKYQLAETPPSAPSTAGPPATGGGPGNAAPKPAAGRPVIRPRPKIG